MTRLDWLSGIGALAICATAAGANFAPTTPAQLVANMMTANANGEDDIIDLGGQTFTLTAINNTVDGKTGLPGVEGDTHSILLRNGTIDRVAVSGFRLLRVGADGSLQIENVVLVHGDASPASGGAIFNRGILTLRRTRLIDNASALRGGAVYNASTGFLTMSDSLASGNTANDGGALYNDGGFIGSLANVTLSGNTAISSGGALYNTGLVDGLTNSTITRNTAVSGGGIAGQSAPIEEMHSTIIAENTAQFGPDLDEVGVLAESMNIVGVTSNSAFVAGAPNVNGSWVGTAVAPMDPGLEALADNGGPTATHALEPGSLAFNHGANPLGLMFDQRGDPHPRTLDGATDVGAYESARDVFKDGFEN